VQKKNQKKTSLHRKGAIGRTFRPGRGRLFLKTWGGGIGTDARKSRDLRDEVGAEKGKGALKIKLERDLGGEGGRRDDHDKWDERPFGE